MANTEHPELNDNCKHLSEEEYTLTITRNEALYLDDCLTLMVEREVNTDHKSLLSTFSMFIIVYIDLEIYCFKLSSSLNSVQ